ncbi:MAG: right-handed parallel beta-helix repeat-containing protein [Planctomycetota bacterium]
MNSKHRKWRLAVIVLVLGVGCVSFGGQTIYVDANAPGSNDGSSWADAYNYLQDALADANTSAKPVEIRVAQGTYKPDAGAGVTDGDREATFGLINGVIVKGGYAGFGKPDPDARDIKLYETILSGDLSGNDSLVSDHGDLRYDPNRAENSYHVVTGSSTNETAILDGFTISGANADSSKPNDRGGGMFNGQHSGPTVTNCTFTGNRVDFRGGGMYNNDYCSLTVTACTFSGNWAAVGGGMSNDEDGTTVVTDCTFSANHATSTGGGMHNEESSGSPLIVTGCTFSGNSASDCGGGMRNNGQDGPCNPIVTDCIFSGNWADTGGGMYNDGDEDHGTCSPILTNCTFIGNSAREYGGGMCNDGDEGRCNPILTNCRFNGNRGGSGAGICSINSSPSLTNCVFIGNTAYEYHGGGMYNSFNSSPTLHNCTFSGNLADDYGAAIYNSSDSNAIVTNCIFWDNGNYDLHNCFATYSCLENGGPGIGNIDTDPCFVMPGYWDNNATPGFGSDDYWVDGDYHLLPGSPCIDTGDPNYVPQPNATDLDGNPRVVDGDDDGNSAIDMGAYEFYWPAVKCQVAFLPRVINRHSRMKRLMAFLILPQGITKDQVDTSRPFTLYPAGIEAMHQRVLPRNGRDTKRTVVVCFFDKTGLLAAVTDNGRVQLELVGRLITGRQCCGDGTVFIRNTDRPERFWRPSLIR